MFVRGAKEWTEQARLSAKDKAPVDRFGNSVSISGDLILVGVPFDDDAGENSGSTYLFERQGETWREKAKLTASDAAEGDQFGWDVGIDGDTAVIGAPLDDDAGSKSGAAYIFVRNADGTWAEQTKLTSSDLEAGDRLGTSVDISRLSNAYAIVGAPFDDDGGSKSGSAYVFVRNGNAWTEQDKLAATDAEAGDNFGISVAIDVNRALIGANLDDGDRFSNVDGAYAFLRVDSEWIEQKKVSPKNVGKDEEQGVATRHGEGADHFGYAVDLSGDFALVGARYDDFDNLPDVGTVYVYDTKEDLNIPLAVEPSSAVATTTLGRIKQSALFQNFPNPFNPETWLPYVLATNTPVTIDIYDVEGQLVRQLNLGVQAEGRYLNRERAAYWDGKDQIEHTVSSGIYFYTLRAGIYQATRRMIILK